MNKWILGGTYFPTHEANRMKSEGDLSQARARFSSKAFSNLHYLLEQRFKWMNDYIQENEQVLELGCGAGFAKQYITKGSYIATDIHPNTWVDQVVDACNLPYEEDSQDVIIASHMIHHLAYPKPFFEAISKVLKPGGRLLISEINTSLLMRLLLWLMKHEGWSYDRDPYDPHTVANDPADPWSANCAIPEQLFADPKRFESQFPQLEVLRNQLCEFSIFPLSGGVIAKSPTIELPRFLLTGLNLMDRLLIGMAPQIFAMGRRIVLQKREGN